MWQGRPQHEPWCQPTKRAEYRGDDDVDERALHPVRGGVPAATAAGHRCGPPAGQVGREVAVVAFAAGELHQGAAVTPGPDRSGRMTAAAPAVLPVHCANMADVPRLGSGIPLVARRREVAILEAALGRARDGRAGAVLLSGDAGVGKSRLLTE